MVTKSTGNKRGRPRKPAPPPEKRRSRGPVPPWKNLTRYGLAAFEACARVGVAHRAKRLEVLEQLVIFTYGEPVPTPDNIERFLRWEPCQFWFPRESRVPPETQRPAETASARWRYKNDFRPHIDGLRNKLDKMVVAETEAGDWHRTYCAVLEICIASDRSRLDAARLLAASIGETEHFERDLRPHYFPSARRPIFRRPIFWLITYTKG